MTPLLESIVSQVSPPAVDPDGPLQLQVSSLDYDPYVGVLGIGRIQRGKIDANSPVSIVAADHTVRNGRVLDLFGFHGLKRQKIPSANAGDIIVFSGIGDLAISDTLCPRDKPEGLPALAVDEPTISMTFQVNKSPFAGTGWQVPDQPADSRATRPGTQAQRRPACSANRRPRQVSGFRSRRTTSLGAHRDHAPRRLRAGCITPGSHHPRGKWCPNRAVGTAHG